MNFNHNKHKPVKHFNIIVSTNCFQYVEPKLSICIIYPIVYSCGLSKHIKKSLKIPSGNQNSYIKEEQTTQWQKEKVQKDKQRSTKHTHKTKDRVTRSPLKTGGELRCLLFSVYWNFTLIAWYKCPGAKFSSFR